MSAAAASNSACARVRARTKSAGMTKTEEKWKPIAVSATGIAHFSRPRSLSASAATRKMSATDARTRVAGNHTSLDGGALPLCGHRVGQQGKDDEGGGWFHRAAYSPLDERRP